MSGGRYSGIAPGCELVMVKVLDRKGNGYSSDVLAGISWILERKETAWHPDLKYIGGRLLEARDE